MNWTAIGAIAATLTLAYLVWKDWPDIKGRLPKRSKKLSERTVLFKVWDAICVAIYVAIVWAIGWAIFGAVFGAILGMFLGAFLGVITPAIFGAIFGAVFGVIEGWQNGPPWK